MGHEAVYGHGLSRMRGLFFWREVTSLFPGWRLMNSELVRQWAMRILEGRPWEEMRAQLSPPEVSFYAKDGTA
jgi:hypothetical protein